MDIKLSVLIPSVPERLPFLSKMLDVLNSQTSGKPVEVICLIDNRKRKTGTKRNDLISLAQGKFVVFVDDDDRISDDYISSLLQAISEHPESDCIVFDLFRTENGKPDRDVKYGIEFEHLNTPKCYFRKPNHLMCYSRQIAIRHKYRDISFGEDDEWGARASRDIVNQYRINKCLYTYDYISRDKLY